MIHLPSPNTIGKQEKKAVERVMKSGVLSDFVGRAGAHFLGGKEVKNFEALMRRKFKVKYVVSFNSATTALEAAIASLQLPPGTEVIVSPFTMSATMTAILVNNLTPIFADIERDTFCLDPASVARCLSENTKAIMVTNLFGGSARYDELRKVARKHRLILIEDNAQAPGGTYRGKYLGTIGDMGIFSFNFHKVIHCGEGGVLVTNNKKFAFGAQLKRNHGENALDDLKLDEPCMVGSNYRLTELHAAIAAEQLKKLDRLTAHRIKLAKYLTAQLSLIDGLAPCQVLLGSKHMFYVYPFLFDAKRFGLSRHAFVKAMAGEGFVLNEGYQKPLHLLRLFHSVDLYRLYPHLRRENYQRGRCPVAEAMYERELLLTTICRYPLTKRHIDFFVRAIRKLCECY